MSPRRSLFTAAVLILITILVTGISASRPSHIPLKFHWEDQFTEAEKTKVQTWLVETHDALEQLVGKLPFTTELYIHRTSSREPVPWANTERSAIQGVHFHIDPSYSLEDFRNDWTAPHELSHLVIPYVGHANSWFAEGFASYMQYQVMHQMGVLDKNAMRKRYQKNLQKADSRYTHERMPFATAAPKLRAERNYPTMYWGGAAYFLQADAELMNDHRPGLVATLARYTQCCRMQGHALNDVVASLDKLSGGSTLADLMHRFENQPGFPHHENLRLGPSG